MCGISVRSFIRLSIGRRGWECRELCLSLAKLCSATYELDAVNEYLKTWNHSMIIWKIVC